MTSIKSVVYDTPEKIRAHWAFCARLRAVGINTNDSDKVRVILHAFDAGAEMTRAFKAHKRLLISKQK